MVALPSGTQLKQGAYTLGHVAGRGGFGFTYRAFSSATGLEVAIKECFPPGCSRDGLCVAPGDSFSSEVLKIVHQTSYQHAQKLLGLHHQGVAKCHDLFEENCSIYLVMEFVSGRTLAEVVKADGPLTTSVAIRYLRQLSAAVQDFHDSGLLHLDLKPDNILLQNENGQERLVVVDFDLVRVHQSNDVQTRPLALATRHGTPGYAAPELYGQQTLPAPSTDLYALAASFHFLLTGEQPAAAPERLDSDWVPFQGVDLPEATLNFLKASLNLNLSERPASVAALLENLDVSEQDYQGEIDPPGKFIHHRGVVYPVRLITKNPIVPTNCACCYDAADTTYTLKSPSGNWQLPICHHCTRHMDANRLAGSVTVWGMLASLALAGGGLAVSLATDTFWPILLGPAGIFVNIYSMSYGGLKHTRTEENMRDVCTDISEPVKYVSRGAYFVWHFKNRRFADEFRRLNAGFLYSPVH